MLFSEMRRLQAIQDRLRTGEIAASDRLDVPTISYIEHPTDSAARDRFQQWLMMAARTGAILAKVVRQYADGSVVIEEPSTPAPAPATRPPLNPSRMPITGTGMVLQPAGIAMIAREDYRAWRDQCPPSLLSDEMTLIARWWLPEKPPKPTRPPVPARDIKTRLLAGESIEAIHTATGASKHAIRTVKHANKIPDCPPGPRGKSG